MATTCRLCGTQYEMGNGLLCCMARRQAFEEAIDIVRELRIYETSSYDTGWNCALIAVVAALDRARAKEEE